MVPHWGAGPSALDLARIVLAFAKTNPVVNGHCVVCEEYIYTDLAPTEDHDPECAWRRAKEVERAQS